jgi:D-galacturonate reductase
MTEASKVDVLMVGTGEYTTGYVGGTASDSDKGAGVVALTMFDLRRRSKVDRVGMCGVNVSTGREGGRSGFVSS